MRMDNGNFKLLLRLTMYSWIIKGLTPDVSFVGLPSTVSLAENSPAGTVIYSFQVVLSPGASIASGYPRIQNSDPLTNAFLVSMRNTTQAQVSVTGTANLDFEAMPNRFVLQVLAVDNKGDGGLQTLTVILTDVDEPPVFLDKGSVLYVLERSSPGEIYVPTVSDPENRPLTFTLNPPIPGFGLNILSASLITTKEFNYLTDPRSYAFNLSVSDAKNTVSRTLVINIINRNDYTPIFLNKITHFTIPEEQSPGSVVTNVTAVVPDDSFYVGFIFYTISPNNYLTIHRDMGLVTTANRMDRDIAPLRNNPTISVTVTATYRPPGPPVSNSITLTVTVTDINDNPPVCFPDADRVELPETEKAGALITTVTCTDNDVEPAFTQSRFSGLSCLGCNLRFALDPPDSNRVVLTENLDFEDPSNLFVGNEYSLSVDAVDKNDTTLKGNAFVYVTVTPVNEFPPEFTSASYHYNVSELLNSGTVIGAVMATDKDLPPTAVSYSIISGGGGAGLSKIFYLDPKLGRIILFTRPDYETPTTIHTLLIRAVDGDPIRPLSATATVTINIIEANDEPPLCSPNKTNLVVPKDLKIGTNIQGFILSCTDKDSPPTSFIYSISGASNLNNHFVFSHASGTNVTRLLLREPFDFESGLDQVWQYSLTVLVSDGNLRDRGSTQTGTIIINIAVVDPDLTTIITTTTPRVTYIRITENSFSMQDWYVWFIIALGAMLLLGLLACLLYHLGKWLSTKECTCCRRLPAEHKEVLIPRTAPPKKVILEEVTKFNTVFDGEEVDPVTKRVYEYNSKSGARRWKDSGDVVESRPQPESSTLVISEMSTSQQDHSGPAQSPFGRADTDLLQSRSEAEGRVSQELRHIPRGSQLLNMRSGQSASSSAQSARGVAIEVHNISEV
ncbi:cadherin-related family member 3-like [Osmerus mordax]|uniref:cadherin-related family member 3-like n=1 Tax=Osmerus mordax TaxID=8014 RepID=UPI00350E923A